MVGHGVCAVPLVPGGVVALSGEQPEDGKSVVDPGLAGF